MTIILKSHFAAHKIDLKKFVYVNNIIVKFASFFKGLGLKNPA